MNKIILYGLNNCGKTSVGQELAQIKGCPFYDTDALMVRFYAHLDQPMDIRSLYGQLGEEGFRRMESLVVAKLPQGRSVVACGGGTLMQEINYQHLRAQGQLLYLRGSLALLKQRTLKGGIPPFLQGGSFDHHWSRHYQRRDNRYQSMADRVIEVTDKNIQEAAWEIAYGQ